MILKNKHLVVIGGPTASGKTGVAIHLAEHYSTEIISADSRQIYRQTSIGTAVPSGDELGRVKHHFIQSIDLDTYYNASMYETDVLDLLNKLFLTYDIVMMAGGSGLYIDAVCDGIDDLPQVDPVLRNTLAGRLKEEGLESLQNELKRLDPVTYNQVDLNNHYRVLKALEVSLQTGIPYSNFLTNRKKERRFNIIRVALDLEREVLYNRINARVLRMIEQGLVDEVKSLLPYRSCNAMKTVGYREIFGYLDGKYTLGDAVERIQNNTRKYARKQLTWFRKGNRYHWFNPDDTEGMIRYIDQQTGNVVLS